MPYPGELRQATKNALESEGLLDWALWQLIYMRLKERGLLGRSVVVEITFTDGNGVG